MNEVTTIQQLKRNIGRPVKYTYEFTLPLIENWLNTAKDKKFSKVIFDQKTGEQKTIELIKPLTIYDFCLTTGIDYNTFKDILVSDSSNETCIYEADLIKIITRVHELIKDNQLTGAILNEYNATIVSRMNGLNETVEISNTGNAPVLNIQLPGAISKLQSIASDSNYSNVNKIELKP